MGTGTIEGWVQSMVLFFRLQFFKLQKLTGITVNSVTFLYKVYGMDLLVITRQSVLLTINTSESVDHFRLERAVNYGFTRRIYADIIWVMIRVNVSPSTVSNKNIVCCVDTIIQFSVDYNKWLLNRNKRLGT